MHAIIVYPTAKLIKKLLENNRFTHIINVTAKQLFFIAGKANNIPTVIARV
jgi:hypothetical protein